MQAFHGCRIEPELPTPWYRDVNFRAPSDKTSPGTIDHTDSPASSVRRTKHRWRDIVARMLVFQCGVLSCR